MNDLHLNRPFTFRDDRKTYIKAKYEEKLFVQSYAADQQEIFANLEAAIDAHSLFDLLQVFGEMSSHGIELTDPLPTSVRSLLLYIPFLFCKNQTGKL